MIFESPAAKARWDKIADPEAVIRAKGKKEVKRWHQCRRDRGRCLGWSPPLTEGGKDRFQYDDGGSPDGGQAVVRTRYELDGAIDFDDVYSDLP